VTDPIIATPLGGRDAFTKNSEYAAWSQAAQILMLSVKLAPLDKRAPNDNELKLLEVPDVPALPGPFTRRDAAIITNEYRTPLDGVQKMDSDSFDQLKLHLWEDANKSAREDPPRAARAAATLVHVCLYSHEEVLRVASASQIVHIAGSSDEELRIMTISTLARGCMSESDTVSTMSADALSLIDQTHPALKELTSSGNGGGQGYPAHTSIIVHGTWARLRSRWWRPGAGDNLFKYLKENVSNDLYDGEDHFRWEGGYHSNSRRKGAIDLINWTRQKSIEQLDTVYAHSHGGNLVLDAVQQPLGIRLLVLLSIAARTRPQMEWQVISSRICRIVDIYTRADLVALADRARAWPNSHGLDEARIRRLPLVGHWFSHSAACDPDVWIRYDLAREIKYERQLAEGEPQQGDFGSLRRV
jgi:hypothetical protein